MEVSNEPTTEQQREGNEAFGTSLDEEGLFIPRVSSTETIEAPSRPRSIGKVEGD